MKVLILRGAGSLIDPKSYNVQEIGLAKALVKRGIECDIAWRGIRRKETREKIDTAFGSYDIISIPGISVHGKGIYDPKMLDKLVKEYDVVQVHEYEQPASLYMVRKYSRKVILYHGPYFSSYDPGYFQSARAYDLMYGGNRKKLKALAKSPLAKSYLVEQRGLSDVAVVGVGIDLDELAPNSSREIFSGQLKLLQVGSLIDRKNPQFSIAVLSRLVLMGIDATLTFIGKGNNEYEKLCEMQARELAVEKRVHFVGKVPQAKLGDFYRSHHFLMMPSKYEIFGMVLLEAMHYGCIPLTSENGGASMLIDESCGVVLDGFDEKVWAQTLLELWRSPGLLNSMSKACVRKIDSQFTWDSLSTRFISSYSELLADTND